MLSRPGLRNKTFTVRFQGVMRPPAFFISSTSFFEFLSIGLPSMKIWQYGAHSLAPSLSFFHMRCSGDASLI
jgi:hypothetical protein